jgi:hypothetical protein
MVICLTLSNLILPDHIFYWRHITLTLLYGIIVIDLGIFHYNNPIQFTKKNGPHVSPLTSYKASIGQ